MSEDSTPPTSSRKRRFGRRRDAEHQVRSDDEWVDTLAVQGRPDEESEPGPEAPERSPFDTTGLDETASGPYDASEASDAIPEDQPADDAPPAGAWYDDDTVDRRSWHRRSHESIDEIEAYIDGVLGTANDPRIRRRGISASELGIGRSRGDGFVKTTVEGLPDDVPLALPFPHDELRSARLVYETEGGYVIELTRAIGGSDRELDRQFYTVSRVGRVEQVLDRLRGIDSRAGRTEEAAAGDETAGRADGHEPLPSDLPPAPDETSAVPARHDEPEPVTEESASEPAPATPDDGPGDGPDEASAPSGDASDADADEAGSDEDDAKPKRGLGALFGRKRGGRDEEDDEEDGQERASEDDLREAESFADSLPDDDGDKPKRRLGGLFGRRRKGDDGAEDDEGDQAEAGDGGSARSENDEAEPVPPAP